VPPIDVKKYPAVKSHLDQYWTKIKTREDQGVTPYNLRSCAYMDDFSKQKITWGNLNLHASFTLAPENMYINAPSNMIIPGDLYLLAVLNSKLADYYIRNLGVTRNGGYFEYKPIFVSQLPVLVPTKKQRSVIESLTFDIYKSNMNKPELACIEKQLDKLVYELYSLSNEEIIFINSLS
jgi:hypothetical protein